LPCDIQIGSLVEGHGVAPDTRIVLHSTHRPCLYFVTPRQTVSKALLRVTPERMS
jgi:hypothetical protein